MTSTEPGQETASNRRLEVSIDSATIHDLVYTVEDCERHRRELGARRATRRPPEKQS